jgi:predicted ferric reductase
MAFAATAALAAVTVSSVRRARAGVRYESWHLIHLYAYLGVGLALPHEVWTGTEFTSSTMATIFWWVLHTATAGSILTWRVAVPLWRSRRHDLVVQGVVREAPGIVSVHLRGRDLDLLGAAAGQFFTWRFRSGQGWTLNPLSNRRHHDRTHCGSPSRISATAAMRSPTSDQARGY